MLKIGNTILKQLNTHLRDKILLLKELLAIEKSKDNKSSVTKSYAEIVTSTKPPLKRIPKLIVKKNNKNEKLNIKYYITEMITKDTNIHAKGITVKGENEVIISCVDENSVNITEELLNENLSEYCMIEKEQVLNPKIKVIGIDNTFNMNLTEIEQDLNERNFKNYGTKCQAVHMYNKNTNLNSVILEVPATIHKQIMEYTKSIFVGYQKCRVFDIINTKPCVNCDGFGHNSNKCRNAITCLICAGEHKTVQCDSRNNLKFANCAFSNLKDNTKYDCNHEATDIENCNIFKNKIRI